MPIIRNGIVCDHRTLRGMEIAGYIDRIGTPRTRTRHWTGRYVPEYRVEKGPKLSDVPWYTPFAYKGKAYRIEYFDGSFKPFVVLCGVETPKFV